MEPKSLCFKKKNKDPFWFQVKGFKFEVIANCILLLMIDARCLMSEVSYRE